MSKASSLSSDSTFRLICSSMRDGAVVHDDGGNLLYVNPAALEIFGLRNEHVELFSDIWWHLRDENQNSLERRQHPVERCLKSGRSEVDQILSLPTARRWIGVSTALAEQDGGRFVIATFRDITESFTMRQRLDSLKTAAVQRERSLNGILSALPTLVGYVDRHFVYRYANKAYEKWYGVPAESLVGRTISDVAGKEAFAKVRGHFENAISGIEQQFNLQLTLPTGSTKHMHVTYLPDFDEKGFVQGVYAVINDLTAQVVAGHLAEKREQFTQRMMNALPIMIGYWDKNLRNQYVNEVYADYLHMDVKSAKGVHLSEVLGPELYAKNIPHLEAALRNEPQNFERVIEGPAGRPRHVMVNYVPDVVEGEVAGINITVVDITHLRDLEKARQVAEAQLVSASKMTALGEMAGGLAHELNNPLAIVSGFTSGLRMSLEAGSFEHSRFLGRLIKIESAVERCARIVRGLSTFARNSVGEKAVNVPLAEIISNTLDFCLEKYKRGGVEVLGTELMRSDIHVRVRSAEVSQILLHLLNNAFDAIAGKQEKWIRLDAEVTGPFLKLRVTDSGRGIQPDLVEKIMQPFFTTKEVGKGSGLGLSISKGLAERNEGQLVYVPDSPNTCFELTLPLA